MYAKRAMPGFWVLVCLVLVGGILGYPNSGRAGEENVYLMVNIHAQEGGHDCKASYANWTDPGKGHLIVPVNSAVKIGEWRKGFIITVKETGKKIFFEFHKGRMNMSVQDYLKLITSPEPVSMNNLSQRDLEGIRDGKAYEGMTKQGVIMALGYPATHKTPSPEANTWVYWTNRFRTRVIEFDQDGKVASLK